MVPKSSGASAKDSKTPAAETIKNPTPAKTSTPANNITPKRRPIITRPSDKRRKTYLRMLRSIIIATIIVIAVLIVLQLFGVNVSSMLAGVGIVSIVVGFALQDAMKDIFRGLEIVSDGYYNIGDIVSYGSNYGKVLSINLRTTKIQDFNTMNIVSIANRNIDKIEVVSGYIYLIVPLPLRIKPAAASLLIEEITKNILLLDDVASAENQGVTAITNNSLNYQIQITCDPASRFPVRRAALAEVVTTLADHKILLPMNELSLHNKS